LPVTGVCAGAANAVVLLGEVDQAKIGGERANDDDRVFERELGEEVGQLGGPGRSLLGGASPAQDGELSYALLEGIERLSFLLDEHFAEDASERAHVAAEWPVDIALSTHGGNASCLHAGSAV
jgi:hypothetical protein